MNKIEILELLYRNLEYCISDTGKKNKESLLLDFMKFSSNSRMQILNKASEELSNIEIITISGLVDDDMIRENEYGKYYIAAPGIWEVEKVKFDIVNEFITHFDTEYFVNKSINKNLSLREKVVLLTLIAVRAFDPATSLRFKGEDYIKDACSVVMDLIYDKLLDLKIIKESKDGLYGNSGNEHRVTNVMRHTTDLPKKTRMLYVNGYKKDQRFFLNVINDGELVKENIKYLLGKVFEGARLKYSESKDLSMLLINIAYQEGPNIVEDSSHSYIVPRYDECILNSFEEVMMGI